VTFAKRIWELVAHLSRLASSRGRWVLKHSAAAHQRSSAWNAVVTEVVKYR
jgi:hypothetical protein